MENPTFQLPLLTMRAGFNFKLLVVAKSDYYRSLQTGSSVRNLLLAQLYSESPQIDLCGI